MSAVDSPSSRANTELIQQRLAGFSQVGPLLPKPTPVDGGHVGTMLYRAERKVRLP
jgi:hypothetical protein